MFPFWFSCTLRIKRDSCHFNSQTWLTFYPSNSSSSPEMANEEKLKWWQFVKTLTGSWQASFITPHCSSLQTFPIHPQLYRSLWINFMNLDSYHPHQKRSAEKNPQSCISWLFFLMKFSLVFKNHKFCMMFCHTISIRTGARVLNLQRLQDQDLDYIWRNLNLDFIWIYFLSWNACMIFFFQWCS